MTLQPVQAQDQNRFEYMLVLSFPTYKTLQVKLLSVVMATVAVYAFPSRSGAQMRPNTATTQFTFEVVSVRPVDGESRIPINFNPSPNGFDSRLSLWQAIMLAYGSANYLDWGSIEVVNGPSWLGDFYEIKARVAQSDLNAWQRQSKDRELLRSALRAVLIRRCKLAIHEQPSKTRIWELTVRKGGPRLKDADLSMTPPNGDTRPSGAVWVSGESNGKEIKTFYRSTMQDLADFLNIVTRGAPAVRDETGLKGRYDFTFREVALTPGDEPIFRYPVDHLGLQITPGAETRSAVVIDHIEKPTPD